MPEDNGVIYVKNEDLKDEQILENHSDEPEDHSETSKEDEDH